MTCHPDVTGLYFGEWARNPEDPCKILA